MSLKKIALLVVASASFCSASAFASDRSGTNGISLDAGTLGAGIEYQYSLNDSISIRTGANYAKYNYDTTQKNVTYDGKLKMLTVEALVDYYPFASSGFRLTAGAMLDKNKITANANPRISGVISVNGVDYTASSNAQVNVDGQFNKNGVAPYVGLGWVSGANKNDGLHFKMDIGALFQKPDVTVTATGVNDPTGTLAANLAAAQADLQSDADKLRIYPVIKLGMTYNF